MQAHQNIDQIEEETDQGNDKNVADGKVVEKVDGKVEKKKWLTPEDFSQHIFQKFVGKFGEFIHDLKDLEDRLEEKQGG